ncbi:transposase [Microbacterium deminutum]|uniref:transposase n=1 Tax=Microbacterium deminutum TaxID=344164 RepID=UPI003CD0C051
MPGFHRGLDDTAPVRPIHGSSHHDLPGRANEVQLRNTIATIAPRLLDRWGVSAITASGFLAAWSQSSRVRSEAAFASLASACPIAASGGEHRPISTQSGRRPTTELGARRRHQSHAALRSGYPGLRRQAPGRRQDSRRGPPDHQAVHRPPDPPGTHLCLRPSTIS